MNTLKRISALFALKIEELTLLCLADIIICVNHAVKESRKPQENVQYVDKESKNFSKYIPEE